MIAQNDFRKELATIVRELAKLTSETYGFSRAEAIERLHSSYLYASLKNKSTGLWRLQTKTLFAMYRKELERRGAQNCEYIA